MSFPQKKVIATIREFVQCESPSDDAASVNRFVELSVAHASTGTVTR